METVEVKALSGVSNAIEIKKTSSFLRKFLAFSGPGYLIAVGYMDPGNWVTDIAGGSKFGYKLIFVIFISNIMAILLQYLAIKLGVVAELDLAQACRRYYSKFTSFLLWILAEIAIIACDIAEIIGFAIGLNLLFNIPIYIGVIITAFDVFILLGLQNKSFRYLEFLVIFMILIILVCLGINIFLSNPNFSEIVYNCLFPTQEIISNNKMLYITAGILGATIMPHNLYLHSSIVRTRKYENNFDSKSEAIKFMAIDSSLALFLAFFINSAILIVAAATFYMNGYFDVCELQDAYKLLEPLLGTSIASTVFAIAILISGQNSTITGTLAGQIIMEGFIDLKLKPYVRRILSRSLAIVPAIFTIIFFGEHSLSNLLIFSQIILSMQLSFAIFPLIQFTSQKEIMGKFKNSIKIKIASYFIACLIASLNLWLVYVSIKI